MLDCSGWRFVRLRDFLIRVVLAGRGGLRVCQRRGVSCLRLGCEDAWFEGVGAGVLCVFDWL